MPADVPFSGDAACALRQNFTLINSKGLHARAAAKFVKVTEQYKASVTVMHRGQKVDGKSMMDLLTLAAAPGSVLEISCAGQDAQNLIQALSSLIANKFYEE